MALFIRYFILLLFTFPLSGIEVKFCFIKDNPKHQANQRLLKDILERENSATNLSQKIRQIASELVEKGFFFDAYEVPQADNTSVLSFNCFALWEGEAKKIPITFFVYVWPAEELALKYSAKDPSNRFYGSIIHSHPIPCAFAVLQGSLVQKNYESVGNKKIRFIAEEMFHKGEGDFDELNKNCIHKLYCRGSQTCLSLHAYGLPTAEKVMACFRETHAKCSYENYDREE